jgi:transcriptional regulator with XRE-family HTH domain
VKDVRESRIERLRKQQGLSARELGEKCQVREVTVRHWEKGMRLPGLLNLEALAAALDCKPEDLVGDALEHYHWQQDRLTAAKATREAAGTSAPRKRAPAKPK